MDVRRKVFMGPHLQLQAHLQSPSVLRWNVQPWLGGVSRQVPATMIPVDGVFSFNHIDRMTGLLNRVYQHALALVLGRDKNWLQSGADSNVHVDLAGASFGGNIGHQVAATIAN